MTDRNHDIEARLRASLEQRAQDVRPDPQTWNRVQQRVRRRQSFRWALSGLTAAAAIVLAAVVLPTILNPGVDFEPADPGRTGEPVPGGDAGNPCGGPEHVAAVFARTGEGLDGTLWARCSDGSESHLSNGRPDGARDVNPAFMPDGRAIVFEREAPREGGHLLVHLDLETGREQVLGGGRLPAFAPDGRMAWVQPIDGAQDLILIGRPFSEPEMEFPVVDATDGEWFDVRRLAWSFDGRTLYAEAGYEASVVFAYDPDTGRGEWLEEPIPQERYAAPSTAPQGLGVAVLARCCLETDGQAFDRADLRLVGTDDARLVNQVPDGFDADGAVWTAFVPVGDVEETADDVRWTGGTRAAWLVGDGDRVWLVKADGTAYPLTEKVSGGAANPSLGSVEPPPPPAGQAPEQAGLPDAVTVTRQRIWQAAAARDYGALEALMGPAFTSSFGGEPGPAEGIATLRRMEEQGQDPFALIRGLLAVRHGVQATGAGVVYAWPRAFVVDPADWSDADVQALRELGATDADIAQWHEFGGYIGWRIGIDADGAWRFLVAGD